MEVGSRKADVSPNSRRRTYHRLIRPKSSVFAVRVLSVLKGVVIPYKCLRDIASIAEPITLVQISRGSVATLHEDVTSKLRQRACDPPVWTLSSPSAAP